MGSEKALSIIIITKDTKDLVGDLLTSIEKDRFLAPSIKEIIVVDNGSSDGTADMVRDRFPQAQLMANDRNMGFAAAVNKGFSRSIGEYVLLLNSDTLLVPGEVTKMMAYMAAHEAVGICGPQLIYPDERPQRSFASVPSLLFEVIPRPLLETVFPRKYPAGKPIRRPAPLEPFRVPSLIGAAIMIKRSLLAHLGGFDERFFFFLEETDLCVRARNAGYEVVLYPDARVIHHQGKTVGKNWVRGRIEYNISLYKFIRKHRPPVYFTLFVSMRLIKCVISLVLLPFLLFTQGTARRYTYYAQLLLWHLKGCPDTAGLRGPLSPA